MNVKLVVATQESENSFLENTNTGKSLKTLETPIELRLFANNKKGLSTVYNIAIEESINDDCVLIFAHDDLTITDYYWVSRILESLQFFDIVGLAGNKRIIPFMPGWSFVDTTFKYDDFSNLSGAWGEGNSFPPKEIYKVGPPRQQVQLLDGMLLATFNKKLITNNVYFDERFNFHYYDLDFCRTATKNNLTLGTTDLFVIHGREKPGLGYNDPNCLESYKNYIDKWGN